MVLHKGCCVCAVTVRGRACLLANTQVSLSHVLLTGEPQRCEGALLVAAVTERLLLTESTPAPGVLLAGCQGHTERLLGGYFT